MEKKEKSRDKKGVMWMVVSIFCVKDLCIIHDSFTLRMWI